MKKIFFVLTLLLLSPCAAYGAAAPQYLETFGEAVPREDGLLQVSGIALNEGAWDEVLVCTAEAEIFNLLTGLAVTEIFEGDIVRVLYTEKQNPFASGVSVYLHAGMEGAADFRVTAGDNFWRGYYGEACTFVTPDGKYCLTLNANTLLLDETGRQISIADIRPGMEMFVWAAWITASVPGQVVPDKIVLIP
jgi:hypothetical protein